MSDQEKYIVIGDVHGCASQLEKLLELRSLFGGRRAIFLGDYVDIGPNSLQVIEALLAAKREMERPVFLCGNHELELMRYLERGDFLRYARLGGLPTIRSYVGLANSDVHQQFKELFPAEHLKFIQELSWHLESDDYLFSHSGYSLDKPLDRGMDAMICASHQEMFIGMPTLKKRVVCGHYFQKTLMPWITPAFVCLDTGCGTLGGPLSALLLPEQRLVQVKKDLDVSSYDLGDRSEDV